MPVNWPRLAEMAQYLGQRRKTSIPSPGYAVRVATHYRRRSRYAPDPLQIALPPPIETCEQIIKGRA